MPKTQTSPTSEPDYVIVRCDGWEGLYFNGLLIHENEVMVASDLLFTLGCNNTTKNADAAWLLSKRSLPVNLKDVKFA